MQICVKPTQVIAQARLCGMQEKRTQALDLQLKQTIKIIRVPCMQAWLQSSKYAAPVEWPSKSGSAPGNRYGWLQHLRSCMTRCCIFRQLSLSRSYC